MRLASILRFLYRSISEILTVRAPRSSHHYPAGSVSASISATIITSPLHTAQNLLEKVGRRSSDRMKLVDIGFTAEAALNTWRFFFFARKLCNRRRIIKSNSQSSLTPKG